MSGVWNLFAEEKNDWIGSIVCCVSTVLSWVLEIPCAIFAFVSMALNFACENLHQGWSQVSDALGLDDWWKLEHTMFTLFIVMELPFILKRSRCQPAALAKYSLPFFEAIFSWGCFLYMAAGLQGGVVFGGKLYYPTTGLYAILAVCLMVFMRGLHKEIAGYQANAKSSDERVELMFDFFKKFITSEATVAFFIAVFGWPRFEFEKDLAGWSNWLVVFPIVGFLWDTPKVMEHLEMEPEGEAKENGTPPKAEEKKDEKADEGKEGESKANILTTVCGHVCAAYNKVHCLVKSVCDRVKALPWDDIIKHSNEMAMIVGWTYGFWVLTEDRLALASPLVKYGGRFILGKMKEKDMVNEDNAHLVHECLLAVNAGMHLQLFRNHISLPF